MTTGPAPKNQLIWRGIFGLLGLFAGPVSATLARVFRLSWPPRHSCSV
jgi:hypothetical protein